MKTRYDPTLPGRMMNVIGWRRGAGARASGLCERWVDAHDLAMKAIWSGATLEDLLEAMNGAQSVDQVRSRLGLQ